MLLHQKENLPPRLPPLHENENLRNLPWQRVPLHEWQRVPLLRENENLMNQPPLHGSEKLMNLLWQRVPLSANSNATCAWNDFGVGGGLERSG